MSMSQPRRENLRSKLPTKERTNRMSLSQVVTSQPRCRIKSPSLFLLSLAPPVHSSSPSGAEPPPRSIGCRVSTLDSRLSIVVVSSLDRLLIDSSSSSSSSSRSTLDQCLLAFFRPPPSPSSCCCFWPGSRGGELSDCPLWDKRGCGCWLARSVGVGGRGGTT
jgi:hypothetical protein